MPDKFDPMLLTSLWVNESDLESDLPYREESEWSGERKPVARVLTSPISAATELSQFHLS